MKYKWTVNKVKLYKLVRDNWPGWYEIPQFQYCEFKRSRFSSFWLHSFDGDLEVYLTACGGAAFLAIESVEHGRVVVRPTLDDLFSRFMVKVVA